MDASQLSQVLQNLLINADQAMPTGGTILVRGANTTVAPGASPPGLGAGPHVVLTVQDEGVGIPPDQQEHIFDPFYTTKQRGSGLGLAVSHSIVVQHDGALSVESTPGEGARFTVYLPASPEPPPRRDALAPQARAAAARVLVMEDEQTIRELLGKVLRSLGHRVELVQDGAEAVERHREALAAGEPYDLFLLDLTVPGGMGGLETLEQLRAREPGVKAVAMSGYSADGALADHARYGFAGALPKPFGAREVGEVLAAVLGPEAH